jgi:hypothetical protein
VRVQLREGISIPARPQQVVPVLIDVARAAESPQVRHFIVRGGVPAAPAVQVVHGQLIRRTAFRTAMAVALEHSGPPAVEMPPFPVLTTSL